MKTSELLKYMALASAGAFAVSKVIENPHLLGIGYTPEQKVDYLIDKLQHNFNLSPKVADLAKNGTRKYYDSRYENAKPITPKVVK